MDKSEYYAYCYEQECNGEIPPSQQKLSAGELKFKEEWQGGYMLINCIDDVMEIKSGT